MSERFLWDFRRTIADVLADVPLRPARRAPAQARPEALRGGRGRELARCSRTRSRTRAAWTSRWASSGRCFPGGATGPNTSRTSARPPPPRTSTASRWWRRSPSPRSCRDGTTRRRALKWLGDYYMSLGVNRFVIHTSVHQPFLDRRPGMTLGPFGQHYTRNNTWAEQSRGWISDLTRSSYLLQQGLFVGDLAYYYGEGAPASVYVGRQRDALARAARRLRLRLREHGSAAHADVGEGRPAGAARRHELPRAGPAGRPRPAHPAGGPEAARPRGGGRDRGRTEAAGIAQPGRLSRRRRRGPRRIGNEVWGDCDGRTRDRTCVRPGQGLLRPAAGRGPGRGEDAARTSSTAGRTWTPRWPGSIAGSATRRSTSWPTRRTGPRTSDVRFRVEGKAAELWHPETGEIGPGRLRDRERPHHRAADPGPARGRVRRVPRRRRPRPRACCRGR